MVRCVKETAGYTLVELSIVLVILATFAAGLAVFVGNNQKEANITFTAERLDEIEASIKRYFLKNGYVPCPASITTAENNAGFGTSTNCTAAAPAGTWDPNAVSGAAQDQIRIGMVPFRELGLSPRYAYDAWRNRIRYAVVKTLASSANSYSEFITTSTNGIIQVRDAPTSGDLLIPSTTIHYMIYVLVSSGADSIGAYSPSGVLYASCTATGDSENCDEDDTFVDMVVKENPTPASYFNDFVRWATNDDLGVVEEEAL